MAKPKVIPIERCADRLLNALGFETIYDVFEHIAFIAPPTVTKVETRFSIVLSLSLSLGQGKEVTRKGALLLKRSVSHTLFDDLLGVFQNDSELVKKI